MKNGFIKMISSMYLSYCSWMIYLKCLSYYMNGFQACYCLKYLFKNVVYCGMFKVYRKTNWSSIMRFKGSLCKMILWGSLRLWFYKCFFLIPRCLKLSLNEAGLRGAKELRWGHLSLELELTMHISQEQGLGMPISEIWS